MGNVELRTRVCRGYAVVVLRGVLDTRDAEDTAAAVAALTAVGQELIIDLEILDFINVMAPPFPDVNSLEHAGPLPTDSVATPLSSAQPATARITRTAGRTGSNGHV